MYVGLVCMEMCGDVSSVRPALDLFLVLAVACGVQCVCTPVWCGVRLCRCVCAICSCS